MNAQGFDNHIKHEHPIWAYIFFFIHLHDTKKSDYTALELYVFKLVCGSFHFLLHRSAFEIAQVCICLVYFILHSRVK